MFTPIFHGQNRNLITYDEDYGFLYNHYAVQDVRNVAPLGCKVPSQSDFETLSNYIGANPGSAIKEIGTDHWISNSDATNSSGFTALGGGYMFSYDAIPRKRKLYWASWTTDIFYYDDGDPYPSVAIANYNNGNLVLGSIFNDYRDACSIRCLVTDGSTVITDVNGRSYQTVVIGTQRWLTEDLKVTKYRNGDDIVNPFNSNSWKLTVVGSWCYYEQYQV